ncbi:hypothetical protein ACYULU_11990 [Breznakiellaceae bacterium SP9]
MQDIDTEQTELIINTLPETLFTHQRNDVSFLIDRRLVIFAEHQSTTKGTKGRSFFLSSCRVEPGSYPPGAPTDPDVPN